MKVIRCFKERFFEKIIKNEETECWEWSSAFDKDGYGLFWLNGSNARAHRLSYELHLGKFPKDLLVLHKCDNPKCVNPNHLFLGTSKDNAQDRDKKGRRQFPVGEKNPTTHLKDVEVIEIRQLLKDKVDSKFIMRQYKIAGSVLSDIRRGRTFKHLLKGESAR